MPCGANSARAALLHRGIPTITGLSARNTIEARDTVATILDLQFLFSSYREAILSDASAACRLPPARRCARNRLIPSVISWALPGYFATVRDN